MAQLVDVQDAIKGQYYFGFIDKFAVDLLPILYSKLVKSTLASFRVKSTHAHLETTLCCLIARVAHDDGSRCWLA